MAQTTRTPPTPPPTHIGPTPRPTPTPPAAEQHPPGHQNATQPPTPSRMPMPMAMPPMITDRNLLDQLRQIYQTSQRHLPVPSGTKVSKTLEDALDEIGEIANKAVTDYTP